MSFSQFGVGDRVSAAAPFGYALLSPPLVGRSGRARCSVLLRRGGALRFRGLLTFFTSPGTWATSLKILSLGLPAWDVAVSPFTDVFAGFRLRVLVVGAGELGFLDWGVPALAFLRGLPTVITKVDSKLRSLESPVCFRLSGRVRLGINMVSVKNCGLAVFTEVLAHRITGQTGTLCDFPRAYSRRPAANDLWYFHSVYLSVYLPVRHRCTSKTKCDDGRRPGSQSGLMTLKIWWVDPEKLPIHWPIDPEQ